MQIYLQATVTKNNTSQLSHKLGAITNLSPTKRKLQISMVAFRNKHHYKPNIIRTSASESTTTVGL